MCSALANLNICIILIFSFQLAISVIENRSREVWQEAACVEGLCAVIAHKGRTDANVESHSLPFTRLEMREDSAFGPRAYCCITCNR